MEEVKNILNILNYLELYQRRSELRPSDKIFDEKHKNNGGNLPSPPKRLIKKSQKDSLRSSKTVSFGVELVQINVTFCLYDVNFFSLSTSGSEMNRVAFGKKKIKMFLTK